MRTTPEALRAAYRARGYWSEQRISDLFAASSAGQGARLALADAPNRELLDGRPVLRLDYAHLDALIESTMLHLHEAGLRKDDVLVTQLPNVAEYAAIYLAAARLGLVLSPVPMQFRGAEIGAISRLVKPKALLTVSRFKNTEPAKAALAVADLPLVLVFPDVASGNAVTEGARRFEPDSAPDPAKRARAAQLEREAAPESDDILTICWTSGTEGTPKGVPRSHNHWIAISHGHLEGALLERGDILLNPFPLVNMAAIGGCFMSWLRTGGTLLLHHPFDLPVYLQQIAAERPNYAIAPPAVLMLLLQSEQLLANVDMRCLRCVGSGSAPLAPAMIRGYKERYGIEIVNIFGSNEGMSLMSGPADGADFERRARFFPRFGRAEFNWPLRISNMIETRLIDPQDGHEILEPGEPGELQIRGPSVFDGYFGHPELTAEVFAEDHWFRSGDLFEIALEAPSYYRFVGRLRAQINRGGFKISPDEIDAILAEHPDIAEAAAVGYPDEVLGERICAVIVPKPERTVDLESLQRHFRARDIAPIKWPERVRVVQQLPRNPVGKVIRNEVAAIAAADPI